jgi:23S rRNA (cytosine1962-C5)-methyltransferase
MMELTAPNADDYEFLDAGNGQRLERWGAYILARPAAAAIWEKEKPELWERADGVFERQRDGNGRWRMNRPLPSAWSIQWRGLQFRIKPTGFGHVGLFPEHACHWDWVESQIRVQSAPCRILHLFAYTGAMSLHAAQAGATVCHVDAVADINEWARENARASHLEAAPIRWITDDAQKFAAREIRRQRFYEGLIFDPPSYGNGPNCEKWILDEHLVPFLTLLPRLAADPPRFVLFTCHTLGFSPVLMKNLMAPWIKRFGGKLEYGTMLLSAHPEASPLPSGFFARWSQST